MNQELKKYIEKAMLGDEEAFIMLCEQKASDILYIAIYLMGNVQDGEDAAQEIIIHMYQSITNLESADAFQVWLYRITKNVCINLGRKKNKKFELISYGDEEVGGEAMDDKNDILSADILLDEKKKALLLKVVKGQPFVCRMCVLMFYFERMSYKEITATTSLTKRDIYNALRKSRYIIQREFEKEKSTPQELVRAEAGLVAPVLTTILREDVAEIVNQGLKQTLMQSCRDLVGGGSGSGKTKGKQTVSSGGKMILGIMVTAGIAAGIYLMNQDGEFLEGLSTLDHHPEEISSQDIPKIEEAVIRTLDDMIGVKAANQLRGLSNAGGSSDEIRQFLEDNQFELSESVWFPYLNEESSLYIHQKQTKMLMIITRLHTDTDEMELAYRFTNQGEALPEDALIQLRFDEWRNGTAEE